jgi:hypothetical protein
MKARQPIPGSGKYLVAAVDGLQQAHGDHVREHR